MPAGLVQAPRAHPFSTDDLFEIRWALSILDPDERIRLYQLCAFMDRAVADGDLRRLRAAVGAVAPQGSPLRACLSGLVGRRLDLLAADQRRTRHQAPPVAERTPESPFRHATRRHHRLTARVGSVGQWVDRHTHWFAYRDLDNAHDDRFGHVPVPLAWQHRTNTPLGLSRRIWTEPDGSIVAEFDLAQDPLGQLAAEILEDPDIGFSIGSQIEAHRYAAPPVPSYEWDPDTGRTDLICASQARIIEVSMTPTPLFNETGVIDLR